ncbi:MAG: helix-turn-helix domain-containing protein [Chloroflexales bacterium]|nr:helix-turn-helix domain-containing protein [Chloroflexales bacterium]
MRKDTSEPREATQEEAVDVGARLRALRAARRLSIKGLAAASGLAINTLSLIEHGKTSPSVSTLQRLAAALRIPLAAFFTPAAPRRQVVYQAADQPPALPVPPSSLADLSAVIASRRLEPLLLTLDPGPGCAETPSGYPGQGLVVGLEGCLACAIGDAVYRIEPGATLRFEATLPHCWQNLGDSRAIALLLRCPSVPPDHPWGDLGQ